MITIHYSTSLTGIGSINLGIIVLKNAHPRMGHFMLARWTYEQNDIDKVTKPDYAEHLICEIFCCRNLMTWHVKKLIYWDNSLTFLCLRSFKI